MKPKVLMGFGAFLYVSEFNLNKQRLMTVYRHSLYGMLWAQSQPSLQRLRAMFLVSFLASQGNEYSCDLNNFAYLLEGPRSSLLRRWPQLELDTRTCASVSVKLLIHSKTNMKTRDVGRDIIVKIMRLATDCAFSVIYAPKLRAERISNVRTLNLIESIRTHLMYKPD